MLGKQASPSALHDPCAAQFLPDTAQGLSLTPELSSSLSSLCVPQRADGNECGRI